MYVCVSDQNIIEIELQTLNCVQSSIGGNNWNHRSREAIESSFQNHSAKLSLNPFFPVEIVIILFSVIKSNIFMRYNALLYSRVSLTYRVKSAHKLKLTDNQLLQWMIPIILIMAIFLSTW